MINLKTHNKILSRTIFFSCISLSVIMLLINSSASANEKEFLPITEYNAQYQLKSSKYKMSIKATRALSIDKNNNASLKQNASVFLAKVDQNSSFKINRNSCEIIAKSYYYHRAILGKKKDYRITFDHEKNEFIEIRNNKEKTRKINGKVYDELSYQEALRCELQNNADIKIGHEFSYIVRTKGKNKHYNFVVSALEKIDTKIGNIESVKVSRIRASKKNDDDSHIWFSKQHNYLLVKFRQQDDDDTYSLDIKKIY